MLYRQEHPQQSSEQLVEQYAPLVKRIAHHLMARLPSNVSLDDLIQSGMLGLLEAANRYQADKGASFETYVGIRIKGAMLDELRKGDWTPRSVHRGARKIAQAIHQLERKLSRDPSDVEIAQELGVSVSEYHTMLNDSRGARLFHFSDLDSEDDEYVYRRASTHEDTAIGVEQEALWSSLLEGIEALPERERLVLALYYNEELNLKEIGKVLGVSESRVSQLHTQAALRLRSKLSDW